jgi:hypothetical protein
MSNYTPQSYGFPRGLDEIGLRFSLPRLPNEQNEDYRRRLLLHSRLPPGPSFDEIAKSVARTVGQFDQRILRVSFSLDSDGATVAPDPNITIKATRAYVYSDYENGVLEKTINIWDRSGAYFLKDFVTELSSVSFLTVDTLPEYEEYLSSRNLMICNSHKEVYAERLVSAEINNLRHGLISQVSFEARRLFSNLVSSKSAISEEGDYYVDQVNGIVWSYSTQAGGAYYSYIENPFYIWWQPVRVEEVNDATLRYATRDTLISDDDGTEEYTSLNAYGAKIANKILEIHPMAWGE